MKPAHLKVLRLIRTFSVSQFETYSMEAENLFRDTTVSEKCSHPHYTQDAVGIDEEQSKADSSQGRKQTSINSCK